MVAFNSSSPGDPENLLPLEMCRPLAELLALRAALRGLDAVTEIRKELTESGVTGNSRRELLLAQDALLAAAENCLKR